jgi:hypothetical protein
MEKLDERSLVVTSRLSKIASETAFRQRPLLIQTGEAMLAVENAQ